MRTWRTASILLLALAAFLTPSGGVRAEPAAFPTTACTLQDLSRPARCGVLSLPENPDQPAGRKLPIHFAIVPATSGKPLPDPITVLMGGPGEDAIGAAAIYARQFAPLLTDRDLLLVDQRGTGQSAPLHCDLFSSTQAPGLQTSSAPVRNHATTATDDLKGPYMNPIDIAGKVMDAFESLDFDRNLYGLVHDDVVYQNMPQEPIYGKAALKRLFDSFGHVSSIKFDRISAAANGDTVFAEHLDHMVINGDEVVMPMTSVYTLKDGKIIRWREYYDMNTFERQLGHTHPGAK